MEHTSEEWEVMVKREGRKFEHKVGEECKGGREYKEI